MRDEEKTIFAGRAGAEEERRVSERPFGLERLLAFSDGVFAIAITLLVLTLDVPKIESELIDSGMLWRELQKNSGALLSIAISFYVVGAFWLAHHRYFRWIARYDRGLIFRNLFLLFWISLLPFSTELVGDFPHTPLAITLYAANIAMAGWCDFALWIYASRGNNLTLDNFNPQLKRYVAVCALAKPLAALVVVAASFTVGAWAHLGWITAFVVLLLAEILLRPKLAV
jgi:uncharacterized membrane protein